MGNRLKEEKAICRLGLHQHDNTGSNYVEENNDIESANNVQDDIPWTSQRLPEFAHHDGVTDMLLRTNEKEDTGSSKCVDVMEEYANVGTAAMGVERLKRMGRKQLASRTL
jgi:hypothetical protein